MELEQPSYSLSNIGRKDKYGGSGDVGGGVGTSKTHFYPPKVDFGRGTNDVGDYLISASAHRIPHCVTIQ